MKFRPGTKLCWIVFVIPMVSCAAAAAQTVNKCVDPSGKVSYSAQPCPTSAKETQISTNANVIATPELRQQAEQRRQQESPIYLPQKSASSAAIPADQTDRKAGTQECKSAQRDYQLTSGEIVGTAAGDRERHEDRLHSKLLALNIACGSSFAGRGTTRSGSSTSQAGSETVVPQNRGGTVPSSGKQLIPSGANAIDPQTGTLWIRSGTGFINPQTGQYAPAN